MTGSAAPQRAAVSPGPVFIGSEIYRRSSYGGAHPLRVPRVSTVIDLARAMNWLPAERYRTSPRARPGALEIWHTGAYIAALVAAEREQAVTDEVRARHHLGTASNPVYPEVYRRPATAAGAAFLAASLLRDGGVVHSPGGGTHHGMPDRANGFCYLNDPVLAILALRAQGVERVAYIDIDAHHPDGVEHAFAQDPRVALVSMHEEGRWPRTGALTDRGAGNVWNLPVPAGLNDDEAAMILDVLILPVVAAHRPQAIILQCGADALEEDPLSRLSLSNNVHVSVVAALRPLSPRFLVLGGGGYNPWSVGRAWTRIWAQLCGAEVPDTLPPKAEAILRALRWTGHSRARNVPEAMFTTLADAPRNGPIRQEVRGRVKALMA